MHYLKLPILLLLVLCLGMTSSGRHFYFLKFETTSDAQEAFSLAKAMAMEHGFLISESVQPHEGASFKHSSASAYLEIKYISSTSMEIFWMQLRGGCSPNTGVKYSQQVMKDFARSLDGKVNLISMVESLDANKSMQPTAKAVSD